MSNFLPADRKVQVLNALVEGASVNSIVRMTNTHKSAVLRALCEAGERAQEILDRELVNLKCKYVQCDELWAYVGKKQKNCSEEEKQEGILGDQYVFVGIDSETKLIVSYSIGKRTLENAQSFMKDLAYRVPSRFQLSTDAFAAYYDAVDSAFGAEIDYATIHKNYTPDILGAGRYSPPQVTGISLALITGNPVRKRISTSHVERQNLTMRMSMRRLTRLTNAFSKKLCNLRAAIALHIFYYNFMRIHLTLRVTPAMEAKITTRIWTWQDLLLTRAKAA